MTAIDPTNARRLLEEALAHLKDLDGIDPDNLRHDQKLPAKKAVIRRQLQYAAHLTEAARLEIMNQYHRFGGENPPEVIP